MPLAAAILPGLVPGAAEIRTGGGAASDHTAAAGVFDALLGEAVSADARMAGGGADDRLRQTLMTGAARQRPAPGGETVTPDRAPGAPDTQPPGAPVKGVTGWSPDSMPVEPDAEWPGAGNKDTRGPSLDSTPVEPGSEEAGGPVKGAPRPGLDSSPVQPDTSAPGAPVKDARGPWLDSTPVEPGTEETGAPVKGAPLPSLDSSPVQPDRAAPGAPVKDAPGPSLDSSPVEPGTEETGAPVKDTPGPSLDSTPVEPGTEEAGAPVKGAPGPVLDSSPVETDLQEPDAPVSPSQQTPSPGAEADSAAQPAAPVAAPDVTLPANAASVRRDAEARRVAPGSQAGKAGDEPAKPGPAGEKAQDQSATPAPASAPAKTPAPDLPAAARSADAFQALLQAQGRPSAEAAAPRAGDMPLDPSGDTGMRSAPDRAAEVLRSSAPMPPGAAPRFAPQTVQTLAAQIVRRQSEGGRVFDIRLDPPELGRVGVRLEMGKDQMVKAMLTAERPDTLQELQRTARDLERALNDAGLDLAENGLSFTLGGERGERDAPGFETPRGARSVVEIDVARPGAPMTALYGFALARAAGLDIQA